MAGLLPAIFPAGCGISAVAAPEAVLSGTWILTAEQISSFIDKELTFNAAGRLTQVSTRSTDLLGREVRVIERGLDLEADLNASALRVLLTGNLVFEGTLDAAATQADGRLFTEITLFNITTLTDMGPGRMVRSS
jgi:hypothetical protein